jgi:hypothetical protein
MNRDQAIVMISLLIVNHNANEYLIRSDFPDGEEFIQKTPPTVFGLDDAHITEVIKTMLPDIIERVNILQPLLIDSYIKIIQDFYDSKM